MTWQQINQWRCCELQPVAAGSPLPPCPAGWGASLGEGHWLAKPQEEVGVGASVRRQTLKGVAGTKPEDRFVVARSLMQVGYSPCPWESGTKGQSWGVILWEPVQEEATGVLPLQPPFPFPPDHLDCAVPTVTSPSTSPFLFCSLTSFVLPSPLVSLFPLLLCAQSKYELYHGMWGGGQKRVAGPKFCYHFMKKETVPVPWNSCPKI